MRVVFVAGSWGSGTTAVIGALNCLGVPTLGPYFQSSDPKTRNTFELIPFRNLIHRYVDEQTVRHKENYHKEFLPALELLGEQIENELWRDRHDDADKILALKMPLASMCLPEICSAFETKIVVVHRPFEEIEASRRRRNWPAIYGLLGARTIYNQIFTDLISHRQSFLSISYGDFLANTTESMETIIDYCNLHELRMNIDKAAKFVKTS